MSKKTHLTYYKFIVTFSIINLLVSQTYQESPLRINNDIKLQTNIPIILHALRKNPQSFIPIFNFLYLDQIDSATKIHKLNKNYYEDGIEGIKSTINFMSDPKLGPLKPFQVSTSLNKAANYHSSMMSKQGELGHIDDTGKGIDIWLKPFGTFQHQFKHRLNPIDIKSSSSTSTPTSNSSSNIHVNKYSGIYELVSVVDEKWAYGDIRRELAKTTKVPEVPGLQNLDGLEVVFEWLVDDGGFEKRNMKLLLKKDEEDIQIGFGTRRDMLGSHDIYNTLIMTKGFQGLRADPGKQDIISNYTFLI